MKQVNRKYKDSLFRDIFNNPERLAEIYEALLGNRVFPEDIALATIDETLFTGIKNDVSFIVRKQHVLLTEHQSTINANMPLRLFMYLAEIYRQYVEADSVYKKELIMLPAPKFYVFYNGETELPATSILRLSDAFGGRKGDMELVVQVININDKPQHLILEKCHALKSYSVFVAKVREYVNHGNTLEVAVGKAVQYCITHDYLREYFQQKHEEEVFDMLNFAWNQERALEVRAAEAMEKGREQGKEIERIFSIRNLMVNLQWTAEKAMDALSIPKAEQARYKTML